MKESTLAIIKPDAFSKKSCGKIIDIIERKGLEIIGIKVLNLSREQAEGFYKVHEKKPFFEKLVSFMTSGKIIVLALQAENAISLWRETMGATNPAEAEDGTIRKKYGTDVTHNACHGSDAPQTAKTELEYFFKPEELIQ